MSGSTAMVLVLSLPLFGALAILLLHRSPNLREGATLLTGVALFSVVSSLVPGVIAGERPTVTCLEMFPGLSVTFTLEPLGMLFALVASGLWIVTSVYSIGYMRAHHEQNQTRYYISFAISIFGAMGVALAGNVLTLFVFYEVLTLATYPLVSHAGTEKAMKGARTYLTVLMSTSVGLLLLAVVWTWVVAGTLDFTEGGILAGKASDGVVLSLLVLYAFGTGKAAIMPVHRWLPAAMVAPTPVSALLHAVAVVKAGVFTVLKVVVDVFGLDFLSSTGANVWLMYAAGTTILLASLIAMRQDNLKRRLAYSTVSQLSYIVLGAAMANSWGILGGGMHIAMHAFGKITLFFCAGAIYVSTHKTEISDMRGLGRSMPITMACFAIGALSVIGLPPAGGTWSKWFLALGAADTGQVVFIAVLMISSLLNIAYLLPIPIRGFLFPPPDGPARPGIREAPILCLIPICFTALACVVLFFEADRVRDLLLPLVSP